MATLTYGSGLRLLECARLRVQDVDFERHEILVRRGKRDKDRVTILPTIVSDELARHLDAVKQQHNRDLQRGGENRGRMAGIRSDLGTAIRCTNSPRLQRNRRDQAILQPNVSSAAKVKPRRARAMKRRNRP